MWQNPLEPGFTTNPFFVEAKRLQRGCFESKPVRVSFLGVFCRALVVFRCFFLFLEVFRVFSWCFVVLVVFHRTATVLGKIRPRKATIFSCSKQVPSVSRFPGTKG